MVPGVEPTLKQSGGGETSMTGGVSDLMAAFTESFAPVTVFGFSEIYAVDPTTGIRTFIFAQYLSDVGASEDPRVPLVQGVFSFKTTAGLPLKVYAMEGVYSSDVRNIGVPPADGRLALVNYILGVDNIVYGRNDAWPQAFLSFTSKENDVLRRNSLITS